MAKFVGDAAFLAENGETIHNHYKKAYENYLCINQQNYLPLLAQRLKWFLHLYKGVKAPTLISVLSEAVQKDEFSPSAN